MKVVLAVLALAAAVNAAPHTLFGGAAIPIDGGFPHTDALGFDFPKALPVAAYSAYSHAAVAPLTYSHFPAISPLTYSHGAVSPLTYSHLPAISPQYYSHIPAPITYSALPTVAVAPAVHPGYVAKTPGATHIAPLPAGLGYASHHINLAAAPGTE